MSWDSGWDNIFRDNEWGKYPSEFLVRYVGRNFSKGKERSGMKVLEVGCGTGANLWFLAREGFSVFGIDGSAVGLERAKKYLSAEGLDADLRHGDIVSLPYDDETFDAVVDVECVYANSLKDSKKIVSEIFRVLKPGGKFFSITFMTGTYGDGQGQALKDEPNTYSELSEGALKKGYGIIRFTSEEDIDLLYSLFKIKNIDYCVRSEKNSQYEIKEWLISCEK